MIRRGLLFTAGLMWIVSPAHGQAVDWRDPRLVIHGAGDAFPVEGSREWVEGHPSARLIILEDAGHFPFIERPQAFFPMVDAFLDGEWPPEAEPWLAGR